MTEPSGRTTGQRVQHHRARMGMSRPVLGGLVGRSAEWVKAVETGRLRTPRLPMLLKMARALDIRDLAELTGDGHEVPVQSFMGEAHSALTAVQSALTDYRLSGDDSPVDVAHQPAPELVWMVADRVIAEGREADDPYAIAGGAWALTQALRDAGRWEEAVTAALDGSRQLEPWLDGAPDDWRGLWGALQYEAGYVHARRGRYGDAWA